MTAPEALFKYTISIEKAESENGRLYLYGVASGLGVDSQGHEMDPLAIQRMAEQVEMRASAGDPVPYLDWHKEGNVLSELGHVVKAQVDEDWNLAIKVELDDKNPAAVYLYDSIKNKGKKFGMSVAGKVQKWTRRTLEDGRSVLRFFDVSLKEISNTTRPIWTPSLGTVLAKAVLDEADATSLTPEGDNPDMSKQDETGLSTGATETAAADEATPDTDATVTDVAIDIENAGARYSKATREKFLAKYRELGDLLRAEGILDEEDEPAAVEKSEPASDDTTEPDESDSADADADKPADDAAADADKPADKADEAPADEPVKSEREQELEKALAEMTARAEAAEAAATAKAKQPQMVVTPETTQPDPAAEAREALAKLPVEQRLAEAFRRSGIAGNR